jgi:hypothetical protein
MAADDASIRDNQAFAVVSRVVKSAFSALALARVTVKRGTINLIILPWQT